ncbi:MAG: hypothetical protein SO194_03625, partial [Sodaliphilus sp.]|nr:hypothetical protein [Sodaliphilus sp.]
ASAKATYSSASTPKIKHPPIIKGELQETVQWKNTGGMKQKHKKQPFGDASASHLSLVLWHG